MRISIDITGVDERALAEAARRLNVPPDELAAAALRNSVFHATPYDDKRAVRVLRQHDKLRR
jgi:hypothetical protein